MRVRPKARVLESQAHANDMSFLALAAAETPPTATRDTRTVAADHAQRLQLLANDSDPDGAGKTIVAVNGKAIAVGETLTLASGATLTMLADGNLSYDPNGKFDRLVSAETAYATGAVNDLDFDYFSYTLAGGSTAQVKVRVTGVDGPGDELRGNDHDNVFRIDGDSPRIVGGYGSDSILIKAGSTVHFAQDGVVGIEQIVVYENGTLDLSDVHRLTAFGMSIGSNSYPSLGPVTIYGSQGQDRFFTGLAADTFYGNGGDDTFLVRAQPAILDGGSGDDLIYVQSDLSLTFDDSDFVSIEHVVMLRRTSIDLSGVTTAVSVTGAKDVVGSMDVIGTSGDDVIVGLAKPDRLAGGVGADVVTGGGGADRFVFSSLADFADSAPRDRITDFSHAEQDRIDLSGVDPDAARAGDQRFTFIGNAAFTGSGGTDYEVRAAAIDTDTIRVWGDVDHDGAADFTFLVDTAPRSVLTSDDFVL